MLIKFMLLAGILVFFGAVSWFCKRKASTRYGRFDTVYWPYWAASWMSCLTLAWQPNPRLQYALGMTAVIIFLLGAFVGMNISGAIEKAGEKEDIHGNPLPYIVAIVAAIFLVCTAGGN